MLLSLTCCSYSYERLTDIQRGRAGYIPKLRAGNRAGGNNSRREPTRRTLRNNYDPTNDGSRRTEVSAERTSPSKERTQCNSSSAAQRREPNAHERERTRPMFEQLVVGVESPAAKLFGETEADIGWWYQPRSGHGPSSSSTYSPRPVRYLLSALRRRKMLNKQQIERDYLRGMLLPRRYNEISISDERARKMYTS